MKEKKTLMTNMASCIDCRPTLDPTGYTKILVVHSILRVLIPFLRFIRNQSNYSFGKLYKRTDFDHIFHPPQFKILMLVW